MVNFLKLLHALRKLKRCLLKKQLSTTICKMYDFEYVTNTSNVICQGMCTIMKIHQTTTKFQGNIKNTNIKNRKPNQHI